MSDMNLSDILQLIQDVRSGLESWGITARGLWVAGGIAFLLFTLSLREVMSWFLRVHQVRQEVRTLRSEMVVLQQTVEELRDLLRTRASEEVALNEAEEKMEAQKVATPGPQRFRFDH